ncbi:tyrosine-type recombinase/integrase [Parendozoicomonas haliclonae]|uniref:Phage integrase family protein n=2 Tax=Parendozoicomonas haliclonae TaxID=1960125 RepID=A0A1X7AJ07_9GAMM|nr:tyrosine-type recombinase/integrase [Parendozoicomonas haliclonae]SMA45166.1 Phage integrase family protein [Parendozoicomonas haliclonae]
MERRASGSIEAYYRYTYEKRDCLIKIGKYKQSKNGAGYSLAECRSKAAELATLRRECGGDLKAYLEEQAIARRQQEREKQRQETLAAQQGTLSDLCNSYIGSLKRKGKKSSYQVEKSLKLYVLTPFPELASAKARDITVEDVVNIIRRMIEAGITTTSNRLRSYLHAAFVYGMKADNDPLEQVTHGKRFYIQVNPVAAVPRQASFERVRERFLGHDEIRELWFGFSDALPNRSPVYLLLLRFMLATVGTRPEQLVQCRWSDFNEDLRTFTFIERKGKSGRERRRVMPLTQRALDILQELKPISGDFEWPFCVTGKAPLRTSSLGNRIQEYCIAKEEADEAEEKRERFTPKDIRRTATNLLIESRVPREQRFLLQSREDGSIESKHYDHSDRLPEKREALKRYDALLGKVLKGEEAKLVDLEEYRQATSNEQA